MSTALLLFCLVLSCQSSGLRFSEAAALAVAERVSDTQAVVDLMNSVFRHSECGPLRAETVLRSCRAQVCLLCLFVVVLFMSGDLYRFID